MNDIKLDYCGYEQIDTHCISQCI